MGKTPENAAGEQPNNTPQTPDATPQQPQNQPEPQAPAGGEAPESAKIGDVIEQPQQPAPKEPKEDQPRMVPEAVVIELKKDLKKLQKQIADGDGATRAEISESLKALGEKHDVDPAFLQEFAQAVKSENEAEFSTRLEKELEPFKKQADEAKQSKIDKVFREHYKKTLEAMPEYDGVANEEVIKALAMNPRNANKTFAEIFEEAYGHLVGERRTFDGAGPGSGKDNAEIDMERAKTDPKYFESIMANPTLKQKYNDGLQQRIGL